MAEIDQVTELLAEIPDLDQVIRAVARERSIRQGMDETGETREIVATMLDAAVSMGHEAVLDLVEGEVTTLAAALRRYSTELEGRDELQPRDRIVGELDAILAYPWPDDEAALATHLGNASVRLEVAFPDDDTVSVRLGENPWEVYQGTYDELGRAGMAEVERLAYVLHRALLARVIGDREHVVQVNRKGAQDLHYWLTRPSGSMRISPRVSLEAVAGGGLLVRTHPYAYQAHVMNDQAEARRHWTDQR